MERSSIAWDNYIRGTWPVEDTRTGARATAPLDVNPIVRQLNEAEGWARWRAVASQELNK